MKVLLTVHHFFPIHSAGTEVLTKNLAKALLRLGHDVRIVTTEQSNTNGIMTDVYQGITVYRISHNIYSHRDIMRCEYNNKKNQDLILRILEDYKPDIVHIMHCSKLTAAILSTISQLSIPIVFTATDFWFVCPTINLKLPNDHICNGPDVNSVNCLKCFIEKTQSPRIIKFISWMPMRLLNFINSVCKRYSFVEYIPKLSLIRQLVLRQSFMQEQIKLLNKVIVPTQIMENLLVNIGVDSDKIIRSGFGLEISSRLIRSSRKYRGFINFAFIGTISEHKGLHVLLKAFVKLTSKYNHSNISLKVYGNKMQDPCYTRTLESICGNLDNINFLGTFPNREINNILSDIDILVVPSTWLENTPLVILSAFANRVPVICTDLPGMTEIVRNNYNGMVFKLEDSNDLFDKMEQFIQNPTLIEAFSNNIQKVKTIDDNAAELEKIYNSLLD